MICFRSPGLTVNLLQTCLVKGKIGRQMIKRCRSLVAISYKPACSFRKNKEANTKWTKICVFMVYYGLFLYIFYCVYKLVLQLNYYFFLSKGNSRRIDFVNYLFVCIFLKEMVFIHFSWYPSLSLIQRGFKVRCFLTSC